jgi:REP element-mobilizing transposase RayT
MDGEDNHVHLLVNYPPKHSVSALVNSLKGVSSRLLRSERPDLVRRYFERCALVTVVLCCQLWWCANRRAQGLHRTAKDPALNR